MRILISRGVVCRFAGLASRLSSPPLHESHRGCRMSLHSFVCSPPDGDSAGQGGWPRPRYVMPHELALANSRMCVISADPSGLRSGAFSLSSVRNGRLYLADLATEARRQDDIRQRDACYIVSGGRREEAGLIPTRKDLGKISRRYEPIALRVDPSRGAPESDGACDMVVELMR